jgi:hypothetical protein
MADSFLDEAGHRIDDATAARVTEGGPESAQGVGKVNR